jgi:hypothetical protein
MFGALIIEIVRQEIEQNFTCYDDILDIDASFMQNPCTFQDWLFVNHKALQILHDILAFFRRRNKTKGILSKTSSEPLKAVDEQYQRTVTPVPVAKQIKKSCACGLGPLI